MFLVGMEESGVLRRALRARGVDAWSVDTQPSADNSPFHIQEDIRVAVKSRVWKRGVIHPVCKYLAHSGIKHLFKNPGHMPLEPDEERWEKMRNAAAFFLEMLRLSFPVACENPRMHPYALREIYIWPFCTMQPHEHGEEAFKETMFWRNDDSFQPLLPTNQLVVPKHGTEEYKRWSQVFRMPPGEHRERDRSRTYPGPARAIAEQWGGGEDCYHCGGDDLAVKYDGRNDWQECRDCGSQLSMSV